jgi:Hypothetical protein (DUF2513)
MKRDPDLIRAIALEMEQLEARQYLANLDGLDPYVFMEHVRLMEESGLLEAEIQEYAGGSEPRVWVKRLTMDGHDFLEAARSDTLWNKAKESIMENGLPWTLDLLKQWLKTEISNGFPSIRGF